MEDLFENVADVTPEMLESAYIRGLLSTGGKNLLKEFIPKLRTALARDLGDLTKVPRKERVFYCEQFVFLNKLEKLISKEQKRHKIPA